MDTDTHPAGTHDDALDALRRAGFRAALTNTGGGCMAYEITLEGGRYLLVTASDLLGRTLTAEDEGWSVGAYCQRCTEDHESGEGHANVFTDDSTRAALVTAVKRCATDEARARR